MTYFALFFAQTLSPEELAALEEKHKSLKEEVNLIAVFVSCRFLDCICFGFRFGSSVNWVSH